MMKKSCSQLRAEGNAYLEQGHLKHAIQSYQAAVSVGHDDNDKEVHLALSNLSAALMRQGDRKAALEFALRCKQLAPPNFVKAHFRIALAYEALGKLDLAVHELDMALQSKSKMMNGKDKASLEQLRGKLVGKMGGSKEVDEMSEMASALAAMQANIARLQKECDDKAKEVLAAKDRVEAAKSEVNPEEMENYEMLRERFSQATLDLSEHLSEEGIKQVVEAARKEQQQQNQTDVESDDEEGEDEPSRKGKVLINVRVIGDMLDVSWEWMGPRGVESAGRHKEEDFVGLYLESEKKLDEYWNIESEVGLRGRSGSFQMRRPFQIGRYEFRYVTRRGTRCIGYSQPIMVSETREKRTTTILGTDKIKYVLVKEPNLLCFWLYIPLGDQVNINLPKDLKLRAKLITTDPDCRIPTMTIDKESKSRLLVLCPKQVSEREYFLTPFLSLELNEQVDLDRSTLSLEGGDFLAARLAFTHMNVAALARSERRLLHPAPVELDDYAYGEGVCCHRCGQVLAQGIIKVNQSPFSPWTDMLEHLTCIPPEMYRGDDPSPAFRGQSIVPKPGVILVDEAFVEVDISNVKADSVSICEELAEYEEPVDSNTVETHLVDRAIQCARCKLWLGSIRETTKNREKALDCVSTIQKAYARQIRLYKHATRMGSQNNDEDLYHRYRVSPSGSLVGSQLCRLADVHECRTARICCDGRDPIIISLWNSDSWIRTREVRDTIPVLKITFKVLNEEGPLKAKDMEGTIRITKEQYDLLMEELQASNALLPKSARSMGDMFFAFLQW